MFSRERQNRSKLSTTKPPKRVAPNERVYAVGDIHGRLDLLNLMLQKVSDDISSFSDERKPRVIFLGDYIDRGDQSCEVVDVLSDIALVRERLKVEARVQFDFLAGNHEIALLNFLRDPVEGKDWLSWGGLQTVASYGIPITTGFEPGDLWTMQEALQDKLSPHLGFLQGLSKLLVSGDVVFVHAGLDPGFELDAQPDEAVYWGRTLSSSASGHADYKVVHGHFASDEPVLLKDRICVDTGGYYSGCLTAVRIDDSETVLQVRA